MSPEKTPSISSQEEGVSLIPTAVVPPRSKGARCASRSTSCGAGAPRIALPFAEAEGGSSFAELVEEATLEHSAAGETVEALEEPAESVVDDGDTPVR